MSAFKDLSGQRFGRLLVMSRAGLTANGRNSTWNCRCDCGTGLVVSSGNLRTQRSCGCIHRERLAAEQTIHGAAVRGQMTAEYRTWASMIRRCHEPSNHLFARYGGVGIAVCNRWRFGEDGKHPFECFLSDMGERPTADHSIDRFPNRAGNYEPTNCRWATSVEQQRNRSDTRRVTWRGVEVNLIDAAEAAGLNIIAVEKRLAAGWDLERALSTPSRARNPSPYDPHRKRRSP